MLLNADNWTGLAGDGNWATAGNWSNGVPGTADTVTISGNGGTTIVTSSASVTIAGLTVGTGATLVINSGSTMSVTAAGTLIDDGTIDIGDASNSGQLTLSGPNSIQTDGNGTAGTIAFSTGASDFNDHLFYGNGLTIASDITVTAAAGSIFGNGAVNNQGTIAATTTNRTFTVSLGSGGLNVGTIAGSGTGTLAVTGLSQNSGNIAANGGNLAVAGTGLSGGNWANTGTGTIGLTGGGTLTLDTSVNDSWSNSGSITVTNSTVDLGGSITQAGLTAGGTFTHTGSTVNLTGTLTGGLTLDATTGNWNLGDPNNSNAGVGTLSGGTFTASGGAILYATFTSALDGMTLASPIDMATYNNTVNVTGDLTLSGGVELDLGNQSNTSTAGQFVFSGTGTQHISGSGAIVFGFFSANSIFTGIGETLDLGSGVALRGRSGQVYGNGGFTNDGTIDANVSGGTITVDPPTFTNNGIAEADAGTLKITPTTLANFSAGTLTGGTWQATGGGILRLKNGSNPVDITTNDATTVLDGASSHIYDSDSGTSNALAGLASVTATGALAVENGAQLSVTSGPLTDAGNIVLDNGTLASGGYQLEVASGGSLSGSGIITGGLLNNGTVSPGTSGVLTITGNVTLGASSALYFTLDGTRAGLDYGVLDFTAAVSLAGSIDVSNANGYTPGPYDTYQPLLYGSESGSASASLPSGEDDFFTPTSLYIVPAGTPAPITVTNTSDSGAGSLRDAIIQANAGSGPIEFVNFDIPTSDGGYSGGVWTISPTSALPSAAVPVILDATTQPGYAGTPVIELDGTSAGGTTDGLDITAVNTRVSGLDIVNFGGVGLGVITGGAGDTFKSNYLGVAPDGATAAPNGGGVALYRDSAGGITIGGLLASDANLISGNNGHGVYLASGTGGDYVEGNRIGTNATGTASLPNANDGIGIFGSSNNIIGGTVAGAGNLISGNTQAGVRVAATSAAATGNVIQGNYIGTSADGASKVANGAGVVLQTASSTAIGGDVGGAGNVISGNSANGVFIDSASDDNSVAGNKIGTDATGLTAVANSSNGIEVDGANNTIGGTTAADRNIVSGNAQDGVLITGAAASDNTVEGNYIGTDATGATKLANQINGIALSSSTGNTIGGPVAGAGNVVSGNAADGIYLSGGSDANTIAGNIVGLNAAGNAVLANAQVGVFVGGSHETVGGTTAAERNVISGNSQLGIEVVSSSDETIEGNYIGTDLTGAVALGNSGDGIYVGFGSNVTIGGTVAGAGNVISGNGTGIEIDSNSLANTVAGNIIGADATGKIALGQGAHGGGVQIAGGGNTIGGTTAAARNIISGNTYYGVLISGASADNNTVEGNYIGTDITGAAALPNAQSGVWLQYGTGNVIGGTTAAARNIIGGNTQNGIVTQFDWQNTIEGNYIGTDVTGTIKVANGAAGVNIADQSAGDAVSGNLISGNTGDGVSMSGQNAPTGLTHWWRGEGNGNDAVGSSPATVENDITYVPGKVGQAFDLPGSATTDGSSDVIDFGPTAGNFGTSDFTVQFWINTTSAAARQIVLNKRDSLADGSFWSIELQGGVPRIELDQDGASDNFNAFSADEAINDGQWHLLSLVRQGTTATLYIDGAAHGSGSSAGITNISNTGDMRTSTYVPGNGDLDASTYFIGNLDEIMLASRALSASDVVQAYHLAIGATIVGNLIGTDDTGTANLANGGSGVDIIARSDNTVGGTTAAARNVISGNASDGVHVSGAGASGNTIEGNYIGVDETGSTALGNGANGITVYAGGNTIGGTTAGAGNVISGNVGSGSNSSIGNGVYLQSSGNTVEGNFIGTNAAGTAALANAQSGVHIVGANNVIGGTVDGARNIISGNTWQGVYLSGSQSTGNKVQGNYIGTDVSGTLPLANIQTGVYIDNSASGNLIGGDDAADGTLDGVVMARNIISANHVEIALSVNSSGNTIEGNYLGPTVDGTAVVAQTAPAINLGGNANQVGGTTAGAGNVIAGGYKGLYVTGAANTIEGNLIGTNAAGTGPLPNSVAGIDLEGPNNAIGGMTAAARNIISGNTQDGILITGAAATGNTVEGNYIGTDMTGTTALANGGKGVDLSGVSSSTVSGNIISGNTGDGVYVTGNAPATTSDLPGGLVGWWQAEGNTNDSSANGDNGTISGTVGYTTGEFGQAFSFSGNGAVDLGNPAALQLQDFTMSAWISTNPASLPPSTGAEIVGYGAGGYGLGMESDGQLFLSHIGVDGVFSTQTINDTYWHHVAVSKSGGTVTFYLDGVAEAPQAYNPTFTFTTNAVIGGITNGFFTGGIDDAQIYNGALSAADIQTIIYDDGSPGNTISGNVIGTDVTGSTALANGGNGIEINNSASNTIGGAAAIDRNLISGNTQTGVSVAGTAAFGNVVEGNYVGVDGAGGAALGNGGNGIAMEANYGTIGGSSAGEGNVVSGNGFDGIVLYSIFSTVAGNYVGVNATGTSAVANGTYGILVNGRNDVIGGVDSNPGGTLAGAGNLVSGNLSNAVAVSATNITIAGNYIGTDAAGKNVIANHGEGIFFYSGSSHNIIGGTTAGERNLISGNVDGVVISGPLGTGNTIEGNYIGTDVTGAVALGNYYYGIYLSDAADTQIGGATASARNVISGNGGVGVYLNSATGNTLEGNYIGVAADGAAKLANGGADGVEINGSSNNTIGGTAPGAGNVISGNSGNGIQLSGSAANNTIQGNYIGTDATGSAAVGNGNNALFLNGAGVASNLIGGTAPGAGNLLSASGHDGLFLQFASDNTVEGNKIGTNLAGDAALGNSHAGINLVSGSGNQFGGTALGAGNVISGNAAYGISLGSYTRDGLASETSGTTIQGNVIGLNAAGTAAVSNSYGGVEVVNAQNTLITDNVISGAKAGSAIPGEPSGATGAGILVNGPAPNTVIQDNRIGTDAAGSSAEFNQGSGIYLFNSAATISGNQISANQGDGVTIVGNQAPAVADGLWHADGNTTDAAEYANGTLLGGATYAPGISGQAFSFNGVDGAFQDNSLWAPPYGRISYAGGATMEGWINTTASDGTLMTDGGGIDTQTGMGLFVEGGKLVARGSDGTAGQFDFVLTSPASVNDGQWHHVAVTWTDTTAAGGVILYVDGAAVATGTALAAITAGSTTLFFGDEPSTALPYYNGLLDEIAVYSHALSAGDIATIYSVRGVAQSNVGSTITGNLIGTDAAGTTAMANGANGIDIVGGSFNTIGGTTAADRNIISGNVGDGVYIDGAGATDNTVTGNYVGTDVTGNVAVANHAYGIVLQSASGNTIGGLTNVPGTEAGNVVSGNSEHGIYLVSSNNNLVEGNIAGLNAAGNAALGNAFEGVAIHGGGGGTSNTIGGTAAGARNVISGNKGGFGGVIIYAGATQNTVAGNYIGTDVTGTTALGNTTGGIQIFSSDNTIGGTTATARNIISGNGGVGVYIAQGAGTPPQGNVVEGNYIGTNAAGTAALANTGGVDLSDVSSNTVGGNVISGNTGDGINVTGNAPATTSDLPGGLAGWWQADGNTNDSSGNNNTGTVVGTVGYVTGEYGEAFNFTGNSQVDLGNPTALQLQNFTIGAWISTNAAALPPSTGAEIVGYGPGGYGLGMMDDGKIYLSHIGIDAVSSTRPISDTAWHYVAVTESGGTVTFYIDGVAEAPQTYNAIYTFTTDAEIGGIPNGYFTGAIDDAQIYNRALSAAEIQAVLAADGAPGNTLSGNYIGTTADGTAKLANDANGVDISNSSNNTIGGMTTANRNIISGNAQDGIQLSGTAASNTIEGNYVGSDATGEAALGNGRDAILLNGSGVTQTLIGGTTAGARNVLSGSGEYGIEMNFAHDNTVEGNFIGTDATGNSSIPNSYLGILLASASRNMIGGPAAGAGNVISGNSSAGGGGGIYIGSYYADGSPADETDNTIQGNLIGLNAAGTDPLPNGGIGVYLTMTQNTLIADNAIAAVPANPDSPGYPAGFFNAGVYAHVSPNTVIRGNKIGTDAAGDKAFGDAGTGISLFHGAATISGNQISGNGGDGIAIFGDAVSADMDGEWHAEGNANDSAYDFNGTLLGGAGYAPGIFGEAFSFDGVNGAYKDNSFAHSGRINYNFGATMEGWINTTASDGTVMTDGGGIDTQRGMGLFVEGGKLVARGSDGTAGQFDFVLTSSASVNDGQWHHVAVTWTGTTAAGGVVLYLDGTAVASGTAQAVFGSDSGLPYFGGDPGTSLPYYHGLLDEVAMYSAALTAGDIATIYSLRGVAQSNIGSTITGNLIGTDASGATAMANGANGIDILSGGFNTIGGTMAGDANTIAFNAAAGIAATGERSTQNALRANSVFANGALGIDLGGTGTPVVNDALGHSGPNDFQNFPVLTSVNAFPANGPTPASTVIAGLLKATPNSTYALDFYSNPANDPSGYGQGKTFIGSGGVFTDSNGLATFSFPFDFDGSPAANGGQAQVITATATDTDGNTSEFSLDHAVNTPPSATIGAPPSATDGASVLLTSGVTDPDATDTFTFAWTVTTPNGTILSLGADAGQPVLQFTPTEQGTYTAHLVVTDSQGGVGTADATIVVSAPAPTVVLQSQPATSGGTPGPAPATGIVNSPLALTGTLVAPTGDSLATYAWSVTLDGQAYALPAGTVADQADFTFTPTTPGNYTVNLLATDVAGRSDTALDSILVTSDTPVATILYPGGTVPEGTPISLANQITSGSLTGTLNYLWTVTRDDGSNALPAGTVTTGPTLSFTPRDEGNYHIALSVTSGSETGIAVPVTITVVDAPLVATIAAADGSNPPTRVEVGAPVALAGSGGTPNTDDAPTLAWSVTGPTNQVVASGSGDGFNFTPHTVGLYVVTLTATDDEVTPAATATASLPINASPPDIQVTLATTGSQTEGGSATVTATVTNPQSGINYSYAWSVVDEAAPVSVAFTTAAGGASMSFTPPMPGQYLASVTVSDGLGSVTFSQVVQAANSPPTPPTVTADSVSSSGSVDAIGTGGVLEGTPLRLSAASTDQGGANDTLAYNWFISGPDNFTLAVSGALANFTPIETGDYLALATVVDSSGASATTETTIHVAHVSPMPTIQVAPGTGLNSSGNLVVNLSAVVPDPGHDDHFNYSWSAIDPNGKPVTAGFTVNPLDPSQASLAETMGGTYVVAVTVTDDDGGTATAVSPIEAVAAGQTLTLSSTTGSSQVIAIAEGNGTLGAKIDATQATTPVVEVALGGNDTLIGGSGPNVLQGDSGFNLLQGGSGPNTLYANAGDSLFGGSGTNTNLFAINTSPAPPPAGQTAYAPVNVTAGTAGNTLSFAASQTPVNVNLTAVGDQTIDANSDQLSIAGQFQYLMGSTGADQLFAAPGSTLQGGGGNDTLTAAGGSNIALVSGSTTGQTALLNAIDADKVELFGGIGNDSLSSTGGTNVSMYGGAGNSTLVSTGDTSAYLQGGGGNSTLSTSGGSSITLFGGTGNDSLSSTGGTGISMMGGSGYDTLSSGGTLSTVVGSGGTPVTLYTSGGTTYTVTTSGGMETLTGSGGSSITLFGGTGNDTLSSSGGTNVSMYGGGGNDSLMSSGDTSSYLQGGSGNSTLSASGGSSITLFGGTGNDSLSNTGGTNVSMYGGGGNSTLTTSGGTSVYLQGGGSNNTLSTSGGSSITLFGGTGNDSLSSTGGTNVSMYGGGGGSTLSASNGTNVYLQSGGNSTLTTSGGSSITLFGGTSGDSLSSSGGTNISLYGGGGNSTLATSGGASITLVGGTGNSTLTSSGGSSITLFGGTGNDSLSSSGGTNVSMYGGSGNDTLTAGGSSFTQTGSGGTETLYTSGGSSITLFGGTGNDSLSSTGGTNVSMYGGSGNSTLSATGGTNSTLVGGTGNSTLTTSGGTGITLFGGTGNDSLSSTGGTNVSMYGGSGNSTLSATGGTNSTLVGGTGNSTLSTSGGSSITLFGGTGNDSLSSTGGTNVSMYGGSGNSTLAASGSSYTQTGSGGTETLYTGGGSGITLFGGTGNDSLSSTGGTGISVYGGSGNDTLSNTGGTNTTLVGGTGNSTLSTSGGSSITLFGGTGNDSLSSTGGTNVSMYGGSGNDTLIASGSSYTQSGSGGSETLYTSGGSSITLFGGTGNDSLSSTGGTNVSLYGGSGNSTLSATGGTNSTLVGGTGNSTLSTSGGSSITLFGGTGNDSLSSTGGTNVSMYGGTGNDSLASTGGTNATLVGGSGNSTLSTSGGSSITLFGGTGNDSLSSTGGTNISMIGGSGQDTLASTGGTTATILAGGNANDSMTSSGGTSITLFGGGGDDTLAVSGGQAIVAAAEAGNNVYQLAGSGDSTNPANITLNDIATFGESQDQTDGASLGTNTIEFAASESGINLDLSQAGNGAANVLVPVQQVTADLLLSLVGQFQNVSGTPGDDFIRGGDGANVLSGGGGNDTLAGGAGPVTLVAGSGDDSLVAGSGGTTFEFAGDRFGSDTVDPATPGVSNTLDFSQFGSPATGGITLNLATTAQQLVNQAAGLTLTLDANAVQLINTLIDSPYDDSVIGNTLDDRFYVGQGNDAFTGGGGNDTYYFAGTQLGHDTISEATGTNDSLNFLGLGGPVSADLSGAATGPQVASPTTGLSVTLTGSSDLSQFSNVVGTPYSDTLLASSGSATLIGAGGQDSLVAGSGSDRLEGNITQVVYLDFDHPDSPTDIIYTADQRDAIQARLEHDYADFNYLFTQDQATAAAWAAPSGGQYATLQFNQGPAGGASNELDFRNRDLGGISTINVNSFLQANGDLDPVNLTATIAAHELGHLSGLRHADAFGPIGDGIYSGVDAADYDPTYTGLEDATETPEHIMASPASVNTTLAQAAEPTYFGEREAIKLAFNDSGVAVDQAALPTTSVPATVDKIVAASSLYVLGPLPQLAVPNTLENPSDRDYGQALTVTAIDVNGSLATTGQQDVYAFQATPGELMDFEVISATNTLNRASFLPEVLLLDDRGAPLPYNAAPLAAYNHGDFESPDATLLDVTLPANADGSHTYYVAVDSWLHLGLGDYQLFMYSFAAGGATNATAQAGGDTMIGGAGADTFVGSSGNDLVLLGQNSPMASTVNGGSGLTTVSLNGSVAPLVTGNVQIKSFSTATSTTIATSDESAIYGDSITLTATVSATDGTPTGEVDFVDTSTGIDLGTADLAVAGGVDRASVTISSLSAASHTIVANYTSDNTTLFDSGTASLVQNVSPAALTITADDASRTYGDDNPNFTASYSGFVNGDTSASLTTGPSLSTPATSASPTGTYAINVGDAVDANYTISYVAGTLMVDPAALTVTATDASRTYGDDNPNFTASYSGFVNGDTSASLTTGPSLSTPATSASPTGTYAINVGGAVDVNYTISYVAGTLTVDPATLTITADDASKVYGQANPTFTYSIAGYVLGQNVTSAQVTGAPVFSTSATAGSPVGSYAITVGLGNLSSPNYQFVAASGTLAITPDALTITADNKAKFLGQALPTFTASYSGFVNGDSPASLTTPVAFGSTATAASPAGTYAITVGGATDPNYSITFVAGSLTVGSSVIVLDAKATGALNVSGNGSLTVAGGLVQVDSRSTAAVTASGNAQVSASAIDVVGATSVTGNAQLGPTPITGAASLADPLADLPAPTLSKTYAPVHLTQGSLTIYPGVYSKISVSGGTLTLSPGVYVLAGGGLTVTGSGIISGDGVMLYNAGSSYPNAGGNFGGVTISGNAAANLTAASSGPYAGIVLFQSRDNTRAISLSGNAAAALGTAIVYAPAALLSLSGNAQTSGSLVVDRLQVTGNGVSTLATDGADSTSYTAGELLAGDLDVYVDNSNGELTADELARIADTIDALDQLLVPYSVVVSQVATAADANLMLDVADTSASGDALAGVLGCFTPGEITLVSGWNWYAGSDPTQIASDQYDFQTIVTHEMGHALGLGHSADSASVMYATLEAGSARRVISIADLDIPDADSGADGLHAAPLNEPPQPVRFADPSELDDLVVNLASARLTATSESGSQEGATAAALVALLADWPTQFDAANRALAERRSLETPPAANALPGVAASDRLFDKLGDN